MSTVQDLVAAGQFSELKALLSENPSLATEPDDYGYLPLHLAVEDGNLPAIDALLAAGVDIQTSAGLTPLLVACTTGSETVVKHLLEQGASTEVKDNDFRTPLHYVAEHGYPELVPLVATPSSLGAKDKFGWTPLHFAAANNRSSTIQALIKAGAPTDIRDNKGRTPLAVAQERDLLAAVESKTHLDLDPPALQPT